MQIKWSNVQLVNTHFEVTTLAKDISNVLANLLCFGILTAIRLNFVLDGIKVSRRNVANAGY